MKIKNYFFSVILSYCNLLLSVVLTFLLANKLEIELVGNFYTIFVAQQYIGYILTFGVGTALIAEFGKIDNSIKILKHFYYHINIVSIFFLISTLIFIFLQEKLSTLLLITLLIGFYRVIYEDLLLSTCNVTYSTVPNFFEILLRCLIVFFIDIKSIDHIYILIIISSIFGLFINWIILITQEIRIFKLNDFSFSINFVRYKHISKYFMTHLITFTQMKLGFLISPLFFGSSFTGIYGLLLNFAETPLKFTTIISRLLLKASTNDKVFTRSFKYICYCTFGFTFIILFFSFYFYDDLNNLFYSNKIKGEENFFLILCFYSFFSVVSNLYINSLNGIGKVNATLYLLLKSLILYLFLILVSIIFDSETLFICSLSISVFVYSVMLHMNVKKYLLK